jgi:hypothetical protein
LSKCLIAALTQNAVLLKFTDEYKKENRLIKVRQVNWKGREIIYRRGRKVPPGL